MSRLAENARAERGAKVTVAVHIAADASDAGQLCITENALASVPLMLRPVRLTLEAVLFVITNPGLVDAVPTATDPYEKEVGERVSGDNTPFPVREIGIVYPLTPTSAWTVSESSWGPAEFGMNCTCSTQLARGTRWQLFG